MTIETDGQAVDLELIFDDGVEETTASEKVEANGDTGSKIVGQGDDFGHEKREGEHEQNADSDKSNLDQETVNRRIAQKHREAKEQQERADRLEAELQQLKAQTQRPETEPVIPPMPDRYSLSDQEYEDALKLRDEAVRRHSEWRYDQQQLVQRQTELQQAKNNEFVDHVNKLAEQYTARAKTYGIDADSLKQIGETIGAYGMNDRLVIEILNDEDGPLIAKYLASAPTELEKVSKMDAVQAVSYIERSVRQKAVQLKPKTSNAPEPATRIDGGKSDPDLAKYPLTAGTQYN